MGQELATIQSKFIRCHQPPAEWFPVNHLNHSCHSCFCGNIWASWKAECHSVRVNLHSQRESRAWSNCKVQSVLEGWTGQNNTSREKSCTDPRFCSKHTHPWQGIFHRSNRLENCSELKRGASHSVFSFRSIWDC